MPLDRGTTDLVSYYKLDEASGNAVDAHGSNTLTDGNTVGAASGLLNGARDFESMNSEYFSGGNIFPAQTNMSWSFWYKPETVLQVNFFLFSKGTVSSDYEYGFYVSAGGVFIMFGNANSFSSFNGGASVDPGDTNWHHAVVTKAGTTYQLYLDDVDKGTGTVTAGTEAVDFMMSGLAGSVGSFHFDGLMDEFGIWHGTLTATEAGQLYNGGTPLAYDDFGGGAPAGQPTMRRWGGVPFVGGQGIGNKGSGRMWGKRRSGIYVPRRFQEAA